MSIALLVALAPPSSSSSRPFWVLLSSLAGIFWAFASVGCLSDPLVWHLCAIAHQLPPDAWRPPDLAQLASALSQRSSQPDRPTVWALLRAAAGLQPDELGVEAGLALLTLCMKAQVLYMKAQPRSRG
jgi:hypothetical protein